MFETDDREGPPFPYPQTNRLRYGLEMTEGGARRKASGGPEGEGHAAL